MIRETKVITVDATTPLALNSEDTARFYAGDIVLEAGDGVTNNTDGVFYKYVASGTPVGGDFDENNSQILAPGGVLIEPEFESLSEGWPLHRLFLRAVSGTQKVKVTYTIKGV